MAGHLYFWQTPIVGLPFSLRSNFPASWGNPGPVSPPLGKPNPPNPQGKPAKKGLVI